MKGWGRHFSFLFLFMVLSLQIAKEDRHGKVIHISSLFFFLFFFLVINDSVFIVYLLYCFLSTASTPLLAFLVCMIHNPQSLPWFCSAREHWVQKFPISTASSGSCINHSFELWTHFFHNFEYWTHFFNSSSTLLISCGKFELPFQGRLQEQCNIIQTSWCT